MSKADEMFEELGYEKQEDKYRIEYSLKQNFTHFIVIKRICFYKIERDIVIEQWNVTEAIKISVNITMPEFQAINLKVKELRLDRRKKMNKKIKIIELLLKIAHGEYPKRFKYNNKIYEYKRTVNGKGYVTENDDWFNSDIFIDEWENLNEEIEILEDNTEEIEELLTIEDYECDKTDIRLNRDKINELVKAVNSIRKDKTND